MNEPRIAVGCCRRQWDKRLVFVVYLLVLLWGVSPAAAQGGKQTSLKIGFENSLPYQFADAAGLPAGPAVDLLGAAAAREGVPFDDMAVLLRSPERHQPLILEALAAFLEAFRAEDPVTLAIAGGNPAGIGQLVDTLKSLLGLQTSARIEVLAGAPGAGFLKVENKFFFEKRKVNRIICQNSSDP